MQARNQELFERDGGKHFTFNVNPPQLLAIIRIDRNNNAVNIGHHRQTLTNAHTCC